MILGMVCKGGKVGFERGENVKRIDQSRIKTKIRENNNYRLVRATVVWIMVAT